jgi:hypothetical protein
MPEEGGSCSVPFATLWDRYPKNNLSWSPPQKGPDGLKSSILQAVIRELGPYDNYKNIAKKPVMETENHG